MTEQPPSDAEIFRHCGRAVQSWAVELSRRLDPDRAARLLLAGAIPVLETVHGRRGAADFLRRLADALENDSTTTVN
jgi:hypothetical protein